MNNSEAWKADRYLVNTAGISQRVRWRPSRLDVEPVLAVNLRVRCWDEGSHTAMIRAGGGSIINITSNVRSRAVGRHTASKWALRGLSKVAALDSQHGIEERHLSGSSRPIHRGNPTCRNCRVSHRSYRTYDIASAALFLASDESRFITGVDLPVDGGFILARSANRFDLPSTDLHTMASQAGQRSSLRCLVTEPADIGRCAIAPQRRQRHRYR